MQTTVPNRTGAEGAGDHTKGPVLRSARTSAGSLTHVRAGFQAAGAQVRSGVWDPKKQIPTTLGQLSSPTMSGAEAALWSHSLVCQPHLPTPAGGRRPSSRCQEEWGAVWGCHLCHSPVSPGNVREVLLHSDPVGTPHPTGSTALSFLCSFLQRHLEAWVPLWGGCRLLAGRFLSGRQRPPSSSGAPRLPAGSPHHAGWEREGRAHSPGFQAHVPPVAACRNSGWGGVPRGSLRSYRSQGLPATRPPEPTEGSFFWVAWI